VLQIPTSGVAIRRFEIGGVIYAAVVMLLGWAVMTDGGLMTDAPQHLGWAELVASVAYGVMQVYYAVYIVAELKRMKQVLTDYYDSEQDGLLFWMWLSIAVLLTMALTVPVFIFFSGWLLAAYGLFFFFGIFYMWFCFVRFVITSAFGKVRVADQCAEEERECQQTETLQEVRSEENLTTEQMRRIEYAVAGWLTEEGHLQHNLTKPDAAREMHVPGHLLTAWVKASGYDSFTQWITALRIKEAKRLLREHPDYSIEAVADHCGISRSNFHRSFKKVTGCSPSEFLLKTNR